MKKKVITQGGGNNLYQIFGTNNLDIYNVKVRPIFNDRLKIGSCKTLDEALSIIRSYSGSQIKKLEDW